jgi:hypothetical protein
MFDIKHKQECFYRYVLNLEKSEMISFLEKHAKIHGTEKAEALKQQLREYHQKNR